MKKSVFFLSVVLCLILLSTTAFAFGTVKRSRGQLVHVVAAYNDLSYWKDGNFIYQRSITNLIIRNTDLNTPITLNSVRLYDPDGNCVKEYLEAPLIIAPLASKSFAANESTLSVEPYDRDEGKPCFLVEWKADRLVNIPRIGGGVHIVRPDGDFVEFLSSLSVMGQVIKEKRRFGECN